jgi:NADH-quinone oxidoreductase subunit N
MIHSISLEAAVLIWGTLLLIFECFAAEKDRPMVGWLAIAGLSLVLILTFFTIPGDDATNLPYLAFYTNDVLALFFKRFALVTTILVLVMSMEYRPVIQKYIYGTSIHAGLGEFFALPVFTCAGLMWMASAVNFVLIFVSLELVTISFYVLVSYMRRSNGSLEAGVKYLILGALSTGFLVYGIAWIFGITGETNLVRIAGSLQSLPNASSPILFGLALVLIGLSFKVAAVPFHLWVPDVYQGAPTPVAAYLSVGSKAAGFVVLLRVVEMTLAVPVLRTKMLALLTGVAALTLIYGNLAALPQDNLKRLLGYSSIAHAGYLLIGVACITAPSAADAICFYLAAYLLMTLLTFFVMIVVAQHTESDDILHFEGLSRRSPFLAFCMLIAMLSLAGVPFTAGFFGKFLIFKVAVEEHQLLLIILGVITVGAGFYYYLKVVRAMYWLPPRQETVISSSLFSRWTMGGLVGLILLLGVYPQPIFRLIGSPTGKVVLSSLPVVPR